jgi:uncharacterized protein (TIGR03032 family)
MSDEQIVEAGISPAELHPLRSVHTYKLAELLKTLRCSLLVSTYQAGKLVVIREDQHLINTHFRNFARPMGIAYSKGRLAIGTWREVWIYQDQQQLCSRLKAEKQPDACFLPRMGVVTGDIKIHEIGWGQDGPWIVNTSFSCLCTLDGHHSFVPRWRPKFITALVPEDRCHINGLAMVNEQPKYVTTLGLADAPDGWRPGKLAGGVIIDVPANETVCGGLCMPHSPRVHRGRLWFLQSGLGIAPST